MDKGQSQLSGLIKRPLTKFDLIQKVGSKGKYQQMLLIIFCFMWGITGMALMGTGFFFLGDSFKCTEKGLLGESCDQLVCSLPSSQWAKYINHTSNDLDTISTELGDGLYCDDTIYIDLTSSGVYVGALVGYLTFSFYSDNFGRRKTLLILWGLTTIGSLILLFSQNLLMVALGFFCIGGGADGAVNMCFNFLGQVVEDQTRQKYSVALPPWFAIGGCLVTTCFIFINNWRIVVLILIVIPTCIIMFFIVIYIEQTPQFLIRKGIQPTLKALNRIGKINKGLENILVEQDVINVINEQVEDKQFQKIITPLDLWRFTSLRLITICMCLLSFALYALYYGPVLMIDKIGFNIYVSSYVVQFSELIVYIPLYFIVSKLKRQRSGLFLFSIVALCASLLLFITKPANCGDFCFQAAFQLFIIAIFRSSSALYFIISFIYMVELYPARSRALGSGIASAFGTLSTSLSPIILGIFDRKKLNPNILFAILSLLSIGVLSLLPETQGKPLKEEIEQIQQAKDKVRKSGYLAYSSKIGSSKSHFNEDVKKSKDLNPHSSQKDTSQNQKSEHD